MSSQAAVAYRPSPQQERVWTLQHQQESSVYRATGVILIEGELDAGRLEASWRTLVDRHEILRTRLVLLPGLKQPVQVLDGGRSVWLAAGKVERGEIGPVADGLADEVAGRSFDRDGGVSAFLRLVRLPRDRHLLAVSLPAHLADRVGLANLTRELAACYRASEVGAPRDGEESVPYTVVAEWLHELLESADSEIGRRYWRGRDYRKLLQLRLPNEMPTEARDGFRPRQLGVPVSGEALTALEALAAGWGASGRVVLLACWQALLARLTGESVVIVGTAVSGRTDEELELALGPFIRYLPIESRVSGDDRLEALVTRVAGALEQAEKWQECFAWSDVTASEAEVSYFPFAFEEAAGTGEPPAGPVRFSLYRASSCSERFTLILTAFRGDAGPALGLHYDAAVLDPGEAGRVAQRLAALLSDVVDRPEAPLAELRILGAAERERLVKECNATDRGLPLDTPLHELVAIQAVCTPDRVAAVFEGRQISYRELEARGEALRDRLAAEGIGRGSVVAVYLERSLEMAVALIGVLKAGAAYLPLDPEYPEERLAFMVADSLPRALVTAGEVPMGVSAGIPAVIALGAGSVERGAGARQAPPPASSAHDLAYVIYTSGSTGRPKGVMVEHRSIVNRLTWMAETYPLGEDDRVLLKTPFSFDASIWEIFTPWLGGARLVIARPGGHRDTAYLLEEVARQGVTVLQLVPSLLGAVLDEPGLAGCAALRRLFCGGEALPWDLVQRFRNVVDAQVCNLYGPTEVAIDATSWRPGDSEPTTVPIGRPLANVQVYLLDAAGNLVPDGRPGELWVGGAGVARGYHARPALTAERFVPDGLSGRSGARLYRTGDLARYRSDGALLFLGRIDHQVKLRGYRIELGEIESTLRRHPGVQDCVVVALELPAGGQRLVAYAVPGEALMEDDPSLFRLPDGSRVAQLNRAETRWLHHEIFEERSYLQGGLSLRDGDVVFDVGANIGLFSLFVHREVRGAKVYAFEPAPPTFEKLATNMALHRVDATLFDCGLSDRNGEATFTFYPQVSASSGLYADPSADARVTRGYLANLSEELGRQAADLVAGRFDGETFTRPLRRLSDVIRENGVERIDYLKIDVEKSELDVLEGIDENDWPKIRQIGMEVHDLDGRLDRIVGFLCSMGFGVRTEELGLLEGTGLFNLYALHPSRGEDDRPAPHPPGDEAAADDTGPLSAEALRRFVAARLPEYMVPAEILWLDELPRTPSGKVDRRALPDPGAVRKVRGDEVVLPRTPVEATLHGLWQGLLGTEELSIRDNFFERGGHSLLATQLVTRVREIFKVELLLRTVFERPTIASLAEAVEALQREATGVEPFPPVPVSRDRKLPLSFAQQRLWFLDQLVPEASFYHVPLAQRLHGRLDLVALHAALGRVMARHEVLRTAFPVREGTPELDIADRVPVPLAAIDLTRLPEGARERELRRVLRVWAQRPFRLDRTPVFRVAVVRLGEEEQALAVTFHHVVVDGWSIGRFFGELVDLYRERVWNRPCSLPELPIQYADFAVWQREWLSGPVLETQLDYWRQRLAGAPTTLELPLDRPRPAVQTFRGAAVTSGISPEVTKRLKALAQAEGVTLFMVLQAGLVGLLHRYGGQDKIVVGMPIAGRTRGEVEPLIGLFINTLALATEADGAESFRDLLARVRDVALGAYAHQDLPFEKLVEEVQPERNLTHQPLFQVMFAFQNTPQPDLMLPGLRPEPIGAQRESAKFELTLVMEERGGSVASSLVYNVDLFDPSTARRLLGHLETLLAAACAGPESRLLDLALLPAGERHQVIAEWNDTAREVADGVPVHSLFERWAASHPDAPAVLGDGRTWSYGELDAEANRLARQLLAQGVGPGSLVAVYLERSPEMVLALMAVFKAGAAYVPLETFLPPARIEWILARYAIRSLITQSPLLPTLAPLATPELCDVVCLDPPGVPEVAPETAAWTVHRRGEVAALPRERVGVEVGGDDLAYVIFTSGSTGVPKGVAVHHRAVANLVDWVNRENRVGPEDRLLFLTALTFDLSVYDVFGVLASGGSVRVASRDEVADPERLLEVLCTEPITFWDSAPAALQQLTPLFPEVLGRDGRESLRRVFLSGDWIPVRLPDRVREVFPNARVIALGGATEATVWSNSFPVREVEADWVSIPYGRPMQNARYRVLDHGLSPSPAGTAGDLFIGGQCLCAGYAGASALTAERFVPDPHSPEPGQRMYATGDRARTRGDGVLQFLGRLDHQVKVRGFRIELGEVETVLGQHPAVAEAVAAVHSSGPGSERLTAYAVGRAGADPDARELRSYLAERLPEYMVPANVVVLSELPLTASGKLDRAALPALGAPERPGPVRHAAPQDLLELRLLQAWKDVLGRRSLGIEDDFFEMGGNSLSAVQLITRIRSTLDRDLPLAVLFQAPTVAHMAAVLRTGSAEAIPYEPLVAIDPRGSRPPLFCVHALGGEVLSFYELAGLLGEDRPVYGLQAPPPSAVADQEVSLEATAERYVEAVLARFPRGRYRLLGYSYGSAVAFAMAHGFRARGHEVAFLGMLDGAAPRFARSGSSRGDVAMLAGLAREAARRSGLALDLPHERVRELARDEAIEFILETMQSARLLPPEMEAEHVRAFMAGVQAREESLRRYRPQALDLQVTLFRSSESEEESVKAWREVGVDINDANLGWEELTTRPLEVLRLPGYHSTLLQRPNVETLARWLEDLLDRAPEDSEARDPRPASSGRASIPEAS